jgi:membrane-bound serine protease (ClpP class)
MRKNAIALLTIALTLWIASTGIIKAEEESPVFNVITISSAITPTVAQYVMENISDAAKNRAEGLIILLDTPGGLDLAMRDIAKSLLNAPIPVIVFVYPSGARAASAGVIITVAAHIAAMAPGTNIGAAHPVGMGIGSGMDKTMTQKVENDAAASARSIAKQRHRNEEWVERAVRRSESITAEEALKHQVIDFTAVDVKDLLKKINGREIELASGNKIIRTVGAVISDHPMPVREKILVVLSDPNIAYILLLIGLAGLYFELAHPGVILPGVIGGISLILSFFAMQTLPVNYAGVALILFGVILFIAEIKIMSHGLLTIGGIISLVMGSLMLFKSPDPALRVSFDIMIPSLAVITLFFVVVMGLVIRAQLRKKHTGKEGMIGQEGKAMADIYEEGKVLIRGEYWNAVSDSKISSGRTVQVIRVEEGLKIRVKEI